MKSSSSNDPRRTAAYRRAADKFLRTHPLVCHWCGVTVLRTVDKSHPLKATVDHLVEVAIDPAGGMDTSRWVVACGPCNYSRGRKFQHRRERKAAAATPTMIITERGPSRVW